MPAVLNAANEVAVGAFLQRRIGFRDIHQIIQRTMEAHSGSNPKGLSEILGADRWARERAETMVNKGCRRIGNGKY
jgi:1-deoxy-D-xylulose-5-phosphate reductoisomerase